MSTSPNERFVLFQPEEGNRNELLALVDLIRSTMGPALGRPEGDEAQMPPPTVVVVHSLLVAKQVGVMLAPEGIPAATIDGVHSQSFVVATCESLRKGYLGVVVVTDNGARRVFEQIPKGVAHVINLHLPKPRDGNWESAYTTYQNRLLLVGEKGIVTSFFTPRFDWALAIAIVQARSAAGDTPSQLLKDVAESSLLAARLVYKEGSGFSYEIRGDYVFSFPGPQPDESTPPHDDGY